MKKDLLNINNKVMKKPTIGEWALQQGGGNFEIVCNKTHWSIATTLTCKEVDRQNALLMIDAGNTYQKCELFPSELLKQRNSLLNLVNEVYQEGKKGNNPQISTYEKIEKLIKEIDPK